MSNKKILRAIIFLMTIIWLGGCNNPQKFAVQDSNLANYQTRSITPEIRTIKLQYTHDLAAANVKLIKNNEQNIDLRVKTAGEKLIIDDFKFDPITDYQLHISAVDKQGKELVTNYQFTTDPVAYPNVEKENETLLQSFYWEMGKGKYAEQYPQEKDLWVLLSKRAAKFKKLGITALWMPPANKAHNQADEGYGAYDLWDLGEFKQSGTVRTKYGTKKELEQAIKDLHNNGIEVYYDAVLNQRIAEGKNNLETVPLKGGKKIKAHTKLSPLKGRQKYYSKADEFKWDWKAFDGIDYGVEKGKLGPRNFKGKSWDDTSGVDYLLGADVDYENENVRHELKEWGYIVY